MTVRLALAKRPLVTPGGDQFAPGASLDAFSAERRRGVGKSPSRRGGPPARRLELFVHERLQTFRGHPEMGGQGTGVPSEGAAEIALFARAGEHDEFCPPDLPYGEAADDVCLRVIFQAENRGRRETVLADDQPVAEAGHELYGADCTAQSKAAVPKNAMDSHPASAAFRPNIP